MEERYIASIDLGTSKLGLCVARVKGDDVQVVYYKETPSSHPGQRGRQPDEGVPLKEAVQDAENELMIHIMQVVVGMPRSEVDQVTAQARIERSNPDEYISSEEVQNLNPWPLKPIPCPILRSR